MTTKIETAALTDKAGAWHSRIWGTRHMNRRQYWRAQCVIGTFLVFNCVQMIILQVAAYIPQESYTWDGIQYSQTIETVYPRGKIVEFTNNEQFCHR